MTDATQTVHGTMVGHNGIGVLLLGESGTGKSHLAAEIAMLGGRVVADDRVIISIRGGMLMGGTDPKTAGILELRHVGLYKIPDTVSQHVIHVVAELGDPGERLPGPQTYRLLERDMPYLRLPRVPYVSGAFVMVATRALHEGRILPPDWHPNA